MKKGVLLVNVGTPDAPTSREVRRYLAEFLMDGNVVDIPVVWRWLLVHGIILRTRPKQSAHAYSLIWSERGSPLLYHAQDLAAKVQALLGEQFAVEVGMGIGNPSLASALDALQRKGVEEVRVIPLFPQFAQATTGSVHQAIARVMKTKKFEGKLQWDFKWNFYNDPGFIEASAQEFRRATAGVVFDHLLLSFHGLPERQILREHPKVCLKEGCCQSLGSHIRSCYRAQCFATAGALTQVLGMAEDKVSVSFQSRVGRAKWLGPATHAVLQQLPGKGVRRLAVMCPSFTTDCLETLEEIGMRGREIFLSAGGEEFRLVPCLNSSDIWAQTIGGWAKQV
ncbi:ferrochelatase [Bdellovibrionota bacterium FG-2]